MDMGKYILPIFLIAALLVFSFAFYSYYKENFPPTLNANVVDENNNNSNKDTSDSINGDVVQDSKSDADSNNKIFDETTSTTGSASPGSSDNPSGDNTSPYGNNAELDQTPSCILSRRGAFPGLKCTVNYIKKDSVSLKIKNNIEENIPVVVSLESCTPILNFILPFNGEGDFVFSCNNDNILLALF